MRYKDELSRRTGGFGPRYPWREIAESGKVGVLVRGEDFDGDSQNPVRAAYQWGRNHGYRVRTRSLPARGEVEIMFIGK